MSFQILSMEFSEAAELNVGDRAQFPWPRPENEIRANVVHGSDGRVLARKLWNNDDCQTENMILNNSVEDMKGIVP